ncbi:hypothetical protein D5086_028359 [Populus alba]|uniref:Uncharacterized protein n=1 Tax=Populus alba TaxID=43335 RepID=A0ACC4AYA8_POPAL
MNTRKKQLNSLREGKVDAYRGKQEQCDGRQGQDTKLFGYCVELHELFEYKNGYCAWDANCQQGNKATLYLERTLESVASDLETGAVVSLIKARDRCLTGGLWVGTPGPTLTWVLRGCVTGKWSQLPAQDADFLMVTASCNSSIPRGGVVVKEADELVRKNLDWLVNEVANAENKT